MHYFIDELSGISSCHSDFWSVELEEGFADRPSCKHPDHRSIFVYFITKVSEQDIIRSRAKIVPHFQPVSVSV
jgi:hypothetical protein